MAGLLDSVIGALPGAASAVASGDAAGVLTALGRSQIGRVEVRSQFSPTQVIEDPLAPQSGPPQEPNWVMRLLKPDIRVYDPRGNLVVAIAPAGEPTENYLPWLIGGTVVVVLGAWVAGSLVVNKIARSRS